MVKLIFFDIDGTLINRNEKTISESTINSLKALHRRNIKCFLATGRDLSDVLKMDVNRFNFDGYLTLNGQLCYDDKFKKIFGFPFIKEEMEVLESIFNAKRVTFEIVGEFARYVNYDGEFAKSICDKNNLILPPIGKYKGETVYQISAYPTNKQKELLNDFLDYSVIRSWTENGVDIIPANGGKSNAIRKLCEMLDIDLSDTMAFGDGQNDIDMIETVGIGVAMGNSIKELKEVANYVTTDIGDNGIENALKHFNLI